MRSISALRNDLLDAYKNYMSNHYYKAVGEIKKLDFFQ